MFRLCVAVLLFQHAATKSMIAVIREYNSHGEKMLTFMLSNFNELGIDGECGFGDQRTRVPLTRLQSIAVGANPVLQQLFDDSPKAADNLRFVDAQSQIIKPTVVSPRSPREFLKTNTNEESNKVWIPVFPKSQSPLICYCYTNEMIAGYTVALIILKKTIWTFHLSLNSEALQISEAMDKKPSEVALDLFDQNQLRGKKRTLPGVMYAGSFHVFIKNAAEFNKGYKNLNGRSLLPQNLEKEFANQIKSSEFAQKLVFTVDNEPLFAFNKPKKQIRLLPFYDQFNLGLYLKANYDPASRAQLKMASPKICSPKWITFSPMEEEDTYAMFVTCEDRS